MSATTKKKHVTKEVLEEYPLPEGARQVVRRMRSAEERHFAENLLYDDDFEKLELRRGLHSAVTASRGNNLHEVETANKETFLASMPTKFRKHVWIKRGDYILVDPIEEGGKVKAEISHILFREQIRYIKDKGLWPEEFSDKPPQQEESIPQDLLPPSDGDDSDEDLADLVINLNRVNVANHTDSDDDDDDSDNDDVEEESDNLDLKDVNHVAEAQSAPIAVTRPGVAIQSENAT